MNFDLSEEQQQRVRAVIEEMGPRMRAAHEKVRESREALRALDQWFEKERVMAATRELIDLGKQFHPDLIVSEVFLSAAGLVAEAQWILQKPLP